MKLYLDAEWDNDNLLSLALVPSLAARDEDFYVELQHPYIASEWVAENVVPKLTGKPISRGAASVALAQYLNKWRTCEIIADWPEDIAQFCRLLIVGPGRRIDSPPLTFAIRRDLNSDKSANPHNALADAQAIRDMDND